MIPRHQIVVAPAPALTSSSGNDGFPPGASCEQPLCCDPEGWGPWNPGQNDFTPCFLSFLQVSVPAFGIAGGIITLLWFSRSKSEQRIRRGWRFWTRPAISIATLLVSIVQLAMQTAVVEVWTSAARLVALLLVFFVQCKEKPQLHASGAFQSLYWLLYLLTGGAKLYSSVSRRTYQLNLRNFVVTCVEFGLVCLQSLLLLAPTFHATYERLESSDSECPSERATILSKLTFSWMTPMLRRGYKEDITEDFLWDLPKQDTAQVSAETLQDAWAHEQASKEKPSLWAVLFRCFGAAYAQGAFLKAVADVLAILQPQLLRFFISFVDSYRTKHPKPFVVGVTIALGMFSVSVGQSLCLQQCFQLLSQTGVKLKAALISAIYRKSLELSNEARGTKSTGDIVNLMAVDSQRLQDVTQFSQHLWSAPLQIILCTVSLYGLLGYSMFAGVALMVVMIPISGSILKSTKELQKQQMKNKDARSKLIAEVIANMKFIKLFAYGAAFAKRIARIRNDLELDTLRKIARLQVTSSFVGSVMPFLVACSAFAVRVLVQKVPLTTSDVFPAIALFQLLTVPLTILPATISSITEASVAVNRLTSFFTAEELQGAVIREDGVTAPGDEAVCIQDASFKWSEHQTGTVLNDICLSASRGELLCLVGRVGAGKSSILHAMLGDLYKVTGTVTLRGSVAYVAQQPWVLNASVMENVVFGNPWDAEFYVETLKACALTDDLALLPNGDQTEVGDRGIMLSGGQKARLTLARAVYARSDVYILDDCLSAVDQHVGRHLIDLVLGPRGLLKDRTRILATNSTPVLLEADSIVLFHDGHITERGTYDELTARGGDFVNLFHQVPSPGNGSSAPAAACPETGECVVKGKQPLLEDKATSPKEQVPAIDNRAELSSAVHVGKKIPDIEASISKPKRRTELTQQGNVKWKIYGDFAKASSLLAVAFYSVALIGAQGTEIGGNVWLKQWSEANHDPNATADVKKYLGVYVAFGLASAVLVLLQSAALWLWGAIEASRKLHESMISSILRAPMSFFDTTPMGQILNRFSSDIYRIDQNLPRQFNTLFISSLKAGFSLGVIAYGMPAFVILIVPLVLLYSYLQQFYIGAKRGLKRLDGSSRSPIFAHFQESLGGLTTIRAYSQQKRFSLESERLLDANMKAYVPSIAANRWLAIRLEFLGAIVILSAAGLALAGLALGSDLSSGMVALMISYALQITQCLGSLVRATGEVETNIISAERVLEYTQLQSEAPDVVASPRLTPSWPSKGSVAFVNYSARYRPDLDLVLRDINLHIKPGERVGVVGRTGAGKSSLSLALFRIMEPSDGRMDIDDLDLSTIGLLDLRRRLAIIPQEPALFEGTVRGNLDPAEQYDDVQLWTVLELARLKDHVAGMTGGLSAKIYEGGSNLSQGQKQLVSLARAMLKPSSILVLDEATAAVDSETDMHIQNTLRGDTFGSRTVITIAHRINTIIDSDRIVVLENGKVIEFDTPTVLMQRQGAFYNLVKEAGLEGLECMSLI